MKNTELSSTDFLAVLSKSFNTLELSGTKPLRRYRRWLSSLTVSMWTYNPPNHSRYLIADRNGIRQWNCSNDEVRCFLEKHPQNKPYHYHDYYELLYVMDGAVHEWIEDECICLQRGDAVLLDKNIRHAEEYCQAASCVFLSLDNDCVQNLLANEPPFLKDQAVMQFFFNHLSASSDTIKAYCHFTALNTSFEILPVEQEVNLLMEEMIRQEAGFWLLMQGHLRRLLGLLESPNLYHCTLVHKDANKSELTKQIIQQIEAHQGNITKQELAALLNYNAAYLCRYIKQNFGKSYTEYCLSVRLNCAAQMLSSTRWSITTICDKLGFSNRTYFYKSFEKEYHLTPSKYRSQHSTVQ